MNTQYPGSLDEAPLSGHLGDTDCLEMVQRRGEGGREDGTLVWSEVACTAWRESLMVDGDMGNQQGRERQIWEWQARGGTYALTLVSVAHWGHRSQDSTYRLHCVQKRLPGAGVSRRVRSDLCAMAGSWES